MSELEAFAGDFYSEELDFVYSLAVREGSLRIDLRGTWSELLPYGDDHFGWGRRDINFHRDNSRAISGFTLDAGNVENLYFRKVASRRY